MAPESSVRKAVLDNGLRIVTESVPYVDSVSMGIWASAGSRDEKPEERGVSHFLEHMLFKGTEKRTARQIADEMDMIGGHLNAFTDKEFTCYYAKVLSEHLPVAMDVLSDMFLHSLFDNVELEREKNVVLEEIKRHEDTPEDLVHDLFAEVLWRKHRLGWSVIGSRKTVKNLTSDILREYVRSLYTPDRVIISAAGKLDHDKLVEMVAEEFAELQGTSTREMDTEDGGARESVMKTKSVEQVHFCIGTPGYSQHDDRRYSIAVMDSALGGGMSSRLFQEIRENRGLVYAIGSYVLSYRDTGLLGIYGGTSMENLDEVLGLVSQECQNLKKSNATNAEIERGKNQIKGALVLGQESMSNRMGRLAKSEIYHGRVVPLQEVIDKVTAVTREDIARVADELFGEPEFTLAAIGPFGKSRK